jgi:hypothetical protein
MSDRSRYRARTEDLAVQEVGEELLVYDRTRDVAHCLTEHAARVWRACEGEGATLEEVTDVLVADGGELGARADAAAVAERALAELQEKRLLAEPSDGVSRRHVLRIAAAGAGALAAPLVVSAAVPRSAEAFKSPASCIAIGSSCTAGGIGQANSYGNDSTNPCCGPGTKGCSAASGTGTGGCFCSSANLCANCVASGSNPGSNCGDGTCHSKGITNRCCCSGVCSSSNNNQCA